jgi:hypothetical protein
MISTHRRQGNPHYIQFVHHREHGVLRSERPAVVLEVHSVYCSINVVFTRPVVLGSQSSRRGAFRYLDRILHLRIDAIFFASRHSSRATSGRVAFSVRYVLNTFMSCFAENGDTPYK